MGNGGRFLVAFVFLICWSIFTEDASGFKRASVSFGLTSLDGPKISSYFHEMRRECLLLAYRGSKYVSPVMEDRLKRGLLTSSDLDRMFSLSENDMELIERKSTVGFLGCIFDLDTAMVDLQKVLLFSYSTLAGDLKQTPPSALQVRDVTGSSLREAIITLGWTVPLETNIGRFEQRFYEIVDQFIDAIPITPVPGIGKLIDDTIRDGNKITVLTALPRSLAIKALKKSNLSPLFQGRIDPENLVSPLHLADFKTISTVAAAANVVTQNEAIRANVEAQRTRARAEGVMGEDRNSSKSVSSLGDRESMRFDGAAVVKCCGLMRKPGMVCVFISANRRNVLSAKRMGLNVVGIQGFSQASHELRAADKVVIALDSLALRDIYSIARRGIKMSQGPDQQTETASAPILSITRSVSAPAKTEDRLPKDTFADEFGSDVM